MSNVTRSIFAMMLAVLALWAAAGAVSAGVLATIDTQSVVRATGGDSTDPDVVYSSGITHVVWSESSAILYSQNSGLGWTPPMTVADGGDPSLTVDDLGRPQLAYNEFLSDTYNIYHTRFVTPTWSPPQKVSTNAQFTDATLPDIARAPNGDLYIVWTEGTAKTLMIAKSTDDGDTWPSLAAVPNATGGGPKIAVGPDGVQYVAWQDTAFRIKRTQRVTTTWTVPIFVSQDSAISSYSPDVAATIGKAHVIWQQGSSVTATIRYAHGSGLLSSTPITLDVASATEPAIAASSNGALIAAWERDKAIFVRMGGTPGWGVTQTLGSDSTRIGHVVLAAGPNGKVYAVFAKGDPSRDIYYNTFTTYGVYLPVVKKNAP